MPCNNHCCLLQRFATNIVLDPFDQSARSASHEAVLLQAALALTDEKSDDLPPAACQLLAADANLRSGECCTSGQANAVPQVRLAASVPRAASRRKCPP
jgi:hypothetical protein